MVTSSLLSLSVVCFSNRNIHSDCGIKIRQKRYEAYNMEWCDLLQQEEQMMKKEGYPYGNAMTTASLVSSIMSPTSAEITRRSSGNVSKFWLKLQPCLVWF